MIGVICKDKEQTVVKEFFQLFKTPWSFYDVHGSYDVVLSTDDVISEVDTKLLIVYGGGRRTIDQMHGLCRQTKDAGLRLQFERWDVPIYGRLATFTAKQAEQVQMWSSIVRINTNESAKTTIRVGYDLFEEISYLLSVGQSVENARVPTLELHIEMLRHWILGSGIPLVEIPPVPLDYDFIVCLTHDVDFVKISDHKFDHTMWGFVYRASVSSLFRAIRRNISWARMWQNVKAVLSLPLVYMGLSQDFWLQFENYLNIERGLRSTYFFIPFKGRAGEKVPMPCPERRAAGYDIRDVRGWVNRLVKEGHEVGVHGIDAWHDAIQGRQERDAISKVLHTGEVGIRMHWLCFDTKSPELLEDAGFSYDSTFGYNEDIGFRAGTSQVFRPLGAKRLLEIPLHIQDVALFYKSSLNMTELQADESCREIIGHVRRHGGVLTLLWHLRSLAPERLWGDFYTRLLDGLKTYRAWFATAGQVAEWFRLRRAISFTHQSISNGQLILGLENSEQIPDARFKLRFHRPFPHGSYRAHQINNYVEQPWTGEKRLSIELSQWS